METFVLIVALLAVGAGLRRVSAFPESTGYVLNMFVIYVSLPALVLARIPALQVSADLWVPVVAPWVMLGLSWALVLSLAMLFRWERGLVGGLLMVVPLGNTSFVGIPVVSAFFGDEAVPYALLYDQFGTFFALAVYGAFVLSVYGEGAARPTLGSIAGKVATFPPFLALVAGFALKGWTYPPMMAQALDAIAASLVPVVMVAVGFQLRVSIPRSHVSALGAALALKLMVVPLIALGLATVLGLAGEPTRVSVFQAAMPPMITAGALAMGAGLAPETMAAVVGLGLLLSLGTLPVAFALLT